MIRAAAPAYRPEFSTRHVYTTSAAAVPGPASQAFTLRFLPGRDVAVASDAHLFGSRFRIVIDCELGSSSSELSAATISTNVSGDLALKAPE
jgi:hypothetical protein